ncbi:Molybdenum cofactor sulfurase [Picochlorum sp. SENEW3]|nr:Molybdenum cofactor sulfurase [Picochlorum sp. SENEW3]
MVWFGLLVVVLFVGVALACRFSSAHDTTTACIQSLLSLIGIGVHRRRSAKDQRGVAKAGGECVYADYAGNAPVDTGLLDACFHELRTHSHEYRNPHSVDDGLEHTDATSVRAIDELRKKTLAYCKAQDDEYACIITHGATSACKIVADCFPWSHRNGFWYLMDNHTSVFGMKGCAEAKGASTRAVFAEEVLHAVEERGSSVGGVGLFAMPLESNFSGRRYSMDLVHSIQYGKYGEKYGNGRQRMRVLLDAAKACASYPPDLSGDVKPDFVVLSYYKVFGYPTGLGALIARRDALREFSPTYVGGGTVDFFVAREGVCDRKKGEEAFEDGTLSYYSIPCACIGFDWFAQNVGSASEIDASSVSVAKRCAERLIGLRHANGRPICRVYGAWEDVMNTSIEDCRTRQGPTVSFNVFDQFGDAYGCRQVNRMASVCGISLRAGALCNSGGLIEALGIPSSEMIRWRNLGYTCDGQVDSIDGVTTGVVRASFGYQSVPADADRIAAFVQKYFMDTSSISMDLAGKKESSELVSRVHVEAMYIYPIKSCQPQQVCSWPLGHDGLQYDRFWKIVDANDRTISLKTCPLLCKVKPVVSTKEETLQIFFDKEHDCVTVPLHGGNAQYSEVNAWLSSKLGISCTLVDQRSNESGKNYSKQGDCLVLFKSSIKYLHSMSGCSEDLETFTQRLRPNLVLSGSHNNQDAAFEDDKWQMLAARDGDIVGRKTKQCTRCGVICMDPHTGKQSKNMEPLRSIMSAKQEYSRKEKCSFGSLFSFNGSKGMVMQCGMEFNTID